jgi:recombination protein RecA
MVELNGLEGSGKSLLAAHIIANTQKKGGIGVFIDTETAAAPDFWKAVGVDLSKCAYVPLTTVEEIFSYMEHIIGTIRKANSDRLLTIVVDSVAAASCDTEMEAEHGKDGYNTSKSIIISKAMRKITSLIGKQRVLIVFTNQLRMNMNAMAFGDKYVVSGGKSLAYHCSVRVRLSSTGKIKKGDDVVGNKCKAQVVKNRMGPPQRVAEFDIFFDSGVQDLASWLDFLKAKGIATSSKGAYDMTLGEEKFRLSAREFVERVNTDTAFKQLVYNSICNQYVMTYRDPNSKIDEDIVVTDDEDAELGKSVSDE